MSSLELLAVPDEVGLFIQGHDRFALVGHKEPDGDCIASQIALAGALRRCGKTVYLLNQGPFDRHEIATYRNAFAPRLVVPADAMPQAAIVVDCSSEDRLGAVASDIAELPVAVIDHHSSGERFGDIHYIRPEIPATTMLVYALIRSLGIGLDPQEAQVLFMGLATDTGFFRFLEPDQHVAFTVAAELTAAGASPRLTDNALSTGRSLESRRLIARLLQRTESISDGAFLLTYQTLADEKEFGTHRDSDALYRLLLAVEGVRVIALVKEKTDGCAVSFRAMDETDVGHLATRFGGGGHRKASGAFARKDLASFLALVKVTLQDLPPASEM